jgi:hypothetical protein
MKNNEHIHTPDQNSVPTYLYYSTDWSGAKIQERSKKGLGRKPRQQIKWSKRRKTLISVANEAIGYRHSYGKTLKHHVCFRHNPGTIWEW